MAMLTLATNVVTVVLRKI